MRCPEQAGLPQKVTRSHAAAPLGGSETRQVAHLPDGRQRCGSDGGGAGRDAGDLRLGAAGIDLQQLHADATFGAGPNQAAQAAGTGASTCIRRTSRRRRLLPRRPQLPCGSTTGRPWVRYQIVPGQCRPAVSICRAQGWFRPGEVIRPVASGAVSTARSTLPPAMKPGQGLSQIQARRADRS